MKSLSIGLCALTSLIATFALAAQVTPAQSAPAQARVRCATYVATPWTGGPTPRFKVEAFSDGPTCAKAVAVIVVRDASGTVLYSDSHKTEFVSPLSDAQTRAQLQTALQRWIGGVSGANLRANLPNWNLGAAGPVDTEFGFTPAEGMTREEYLAIKAGRAPLLCYVQGMESLRCLVYRNGGLEIFGIQAFPG